MNLADSIKIVMESEKSRKFILKFAKQKYNEKFPDYPKDGWRSFNTFKILSKDVIEISYRFGYGDYEYEDSFEINVSDEIRDEKIESIL